MDDPLTQAADALNDHQVTDDRGNLTSETTDIEESATQEINTDEEALTGENPAESESEETNSDDEETEPNSGVDESGRRYVPEKRFKEVYAKQKQLERQLEAEKAAKSQGINPTETALPQQPNLNQSVDKTTALELELLKTTLPQFNPDSKEYSPELDKLGAQIYNANPGITMAEAGRRAIATAKALTSKTANIVAEARAVKAQQSDQGIVGRVRSRGEAETPDPNKMTLEQMEEFLKSNGQW